MYENETDRQTDIKQLKQNNSNEKINKKGSVKIIIVYK